MHDDLARARAESAALLNLDPDRLSPAGALKCDLVSALRLVIDDELARATSGSGADLGKLIVAVEHLVGFLKEARPAESAPAVPSVYAQDPHKVLEDIVDRWIEAEEAERAERGLSGLMPDLPSAQARIDELEAELAALRNALPAPDGAERSALPAPERTITPGEANVIEPSRLYIGPQRGPDDPPPRSTAVIEGKAVPPAPTAAEREAKRQAINNDRTAYTQQGLRPAGGEPWRGHVGGVDESFFWGGSTGKRAW